MKERFRILPMKALAGLSLLLGYLPVFLLAMVAAALYRHYKPNILKKL